MPPKRALNGFVFMLPLILAGALQACRGYKDRPNLTPLMNAAAHSDLARVRDLLAHGADVKPRTDKGETALYEAIERYDASIDNLPTVDALLKSGADPNEREIFGASALSVSLTRDYANPAVTMRLLEAGAIVPHDCGEEGDSLLSLATQQSSLEVMRALIDRGAPVNCEYRGASALYWAVSNGQVDRVTLLLQNRADPTIQVGSKTLLEVATCPTCELRVRANFAKTRDLIENALRSAPTK
jgi:ankyrin repeat protein